MCREPLVVWNQAARGHVTAVPIGKVQNLATGYFKYSVFTTVFKTVLNYDVACFIKNSNYEIIEDTKILDSKALTDYGRGCMGQFNFESQNF